MGRSPLGYPAPIMVEPREVRPEQPFITESNRGDPYISIGVIVNSTPKTEAKLYLGDVFRHVMIAGSTGAGKTVTASLIAKRLASKLGIDIYVIDWHGEYSEMIESALTVTPEDWPVPLFTGRDDDLDTLSSVLELTPSQEYLLEKILHYNVKSRVDIHRFLELVENYPEDAYWMRETKISLHRKLSVVARGGNARFFKFWGNTPSPVLLENSGQRGVTVVDVSLIKDPSARKIYSGLVAKRIADALLAANKPGVIVLEESQNYLSPSQPLKALATMLREIRKNRVGLVTIAQSPSQLINDALANTNTKVIHALKSSVDIEAIARSMYLGQELLEEIPYMEPGEAVYYSPYLKKPVLIKVC